LGNKVLLAQIGGSLSQNVKILIIKGNFFGSNPSNPPFLPSSPNSWEKLTPNSLKTLIPFPLQKGKKLRSLLKKVMPVGLKEEDYK